MSFHGTRSEVEPHAEDVHFHNSVEARFCRDLNSKVDTLEYPQVCILDKCKQNLYSGQKKRLNVGLLVDCQ